MSEQTMATVLFVSVFVFLFFKFCLGGPLGPLDVERDGDGVNLAVNGGALGPSFGVPAAVYRKCPVGQVYSIGVGECKDLVWSSTKSLTQRLQVLMPYLVGATSAAGGAAVPMPR